MNSQEAYNVLEACTVFFPQKSPDVCTPALLRLKADARALWAVRVLDAWARHNLCDPPHAERHLDGPRDNPVRFGVEYVDKNGYHVSSRAGNEDAARIAAAEALIAEDPSLGVGL